MFKQPKPVMRTDTYVDLTSSISAAINKIIANPMTLPYRNCLNCEHWKYTDDLCGLYGAKPPTEILVYGCDSHKDDQDIPF